MKNLTKSLFCNDQETGTNYNYFRDYDPATGRYAQSNPIGWDGGINTYGYVGDHPLSSIDPLGWLEICKKIVEDQWRQIARAEKIVGYKSFGSSNDTLGSIIDAITTIKPGCLLKKDSYLPKCPAKPAIQSEI